MIRIPSPLARASVPLAVPPSIKLSSAAVVVTFVPPISKVVTVISPLTVKSEPSNVKFASPFKESEPVPVTTLLLPSFAKVIPAAAQDKVPEPSVAN